MSEEVLLPASASDSSSAGAGEWKEAGEPKASVGRSGARERRWEEGAGRLSGGKLGSLEVHEGGVRERLCVRQGDAERGRWRFAVHSSCDIPRTVWTMLRGEIWVALGHFAACCMVVALEVTGWALGRCLGLPLVSSLENGPFPPYFGLAPSLIVGACHVCLWEEGGKVWLSLFSTGEVGRDSLGPKCEPQCLRLAL